MAATRPRPGDPRDPGSHARTRTRTNGRPTRCWLSLLAGGAAALLLSTILVANMLNNLFTQQIPQIGIMKAVGARSGAHRPPVPGDDAAGGRGGHAARAGPGRPARPRRGRRSSSASSVSSRPASRLHGGPTLVIVRRRPRPATGDGAGPAGQGQPHHRSGGDRPPRRRHRSRARRPACWPGSSRIRRLDRGLLMALRNTVRRPARFWLSVGLLASAGMVFVAGMSLSSGTAGDRGRSQSSSAPGTSTCNWPARPRWTRSPPWCSRCPASAGSRASTWRRPASPGPDRSRSPAPIPTRDTAACR